MEQGERCVCALHVISMDETLLIMMKLWVEHAWDLNKTHICICVVCCHSMDVDLVMILEKKKEIGYDELHEGRFVAFDEWRYFYEFVALWRENWRCEN